MPGEEAVVSTTGENTSAEEVETKEQKLERAQTLFSEGKKQYICGTFDEASKNLADACEIFASVHGDFGDECGDCYFYYGKTLLELGRLEPGVFGVALDGVTEEDGAGEEDEEEGDEDAEGTDSKPDEVADADKGPKSEVPKADGVEDQKKPDEEQFEDAEKLTGTEDQATEGDKEEEKEAEEGENASEEPERSAAGDNAEEASTNDVPNLQLAWEMLDMARVIFEKEGDSGREKLIECRLALGEVGIEDEQYDRALEDLSACLELQKPEENLGDRRIAQTYFQIGRAHNLNCKYGLAANSFEKAKDVIESKITTVKTAMEKATDEEKAKFECEIKELEALLPDMRSKVEDCRGSEKIEAERKAAEGETSGAASNGVGMGQVDSTAATGATDIKEPTNISHLMRKPLKRQASGEVASAAPDDPKRARECSAETEKESPVMTNGHSKEAASDEPMTNGHAGEVPAV